MPGSAPTPSARASQLQAALGATKAELSTARAAAQRAKTGLDGIKREADVVVASSPGSPRLLPLRAHYTRLCREFVAGVRALETAKQEVTDAETNALAQVYVAATRGSVPLEAARAQAAADPEALLRGLAAAQTVALGVPAGEPTQQEAWGTGRTQSQALLPRGNSGENTTAAAQPVECEAAAFEAAARAQEARALVHSIREINGVMQDVALLVAHQSSDFAKIEASVEEAVVWVDKGNDQIISAIKKAKRRRKCCCGLLLGTTVLIGVITGVLTIAMTGALKSM